MIIDALEILGISIVIAGIAILVVLYRPSARRRRRHRRHSGRPKIDLFKHEAAEAPPEGDA